MGTGKSCLRAGLKITGIEKAFRAQDAWKAFYGISFIYTISNMLIQYAGVPVLRGLAH